MQKTKHPLAAVRMTNDLRVKLVDLAAGRAFDAKFAALKEKLKQIVLDDISNQIERRDLLRKAPNGHYPILGTVNIKNDDWNLRKTVDFRDDQIRVPFNVELGGGYKMTQRCIDACSPLLVRFHKAELEQASLKNQIRGILKACHTIGQMLRVWPQAVRLIPALGLKEPSRSEFLPAIPISAINRLVFASKED